MRTGIGERIAQHQGVATLLVAVPTGRAIRFQVTWRPCTEVWLGIVNMSALKSSSCAHLGERNAEVAKLKQDETRLEG